VPTDRALAQPYEAMLTHPLASGPGVCAVCHTAMAVGRTTCHACSETLAAYPDGVADVVVPISVAVRHGQLAAELWRYKEADGADARRVHQLRLAAVLWRFLAGHERCVADAAGVDAFDVVTSVPSTGGRIRHPLREIAGEMVGATKGRYVELLAANSALPPDRRVHSDRFGVVGGEDSTDPTGASVLVLDDTWTRGGHAQSASVALKTAGARKVGVVVLGRHFDPDYPASGVYLQQARKTAFSWEHCCVHRQGLW
jgi:predicted amidophosphoribosyltransferase